MRRELLACGLSNEGQLGMRSDSDVIAVPDRIIGAPIDGDGVAVKAVACGERHSLLLSNEGKVWSVGSNEDGQLGRGGRGVGSYTIYPVSLSGGVNAVQIAAGRSHSLAVSDDGRLFAWGSNEHGQIAMPSNIRWQETPKRIASLTEVVQVATGIDNCIALMQNGNVVVFGLQEDGAIYHAPSDVLELVGVPIVRVAAGGRHFVALSATGAVYTWGQNEYGQLGTGDCEGRKTPTLIAGISDMHVVEVACGDRHTVFLTREGRLFACGSDKFGQLGCGRKIEKRSTPSAISELMGSHVSRVACGSQHTIAVIGGRLYPFGLNSSGQLGNGELRSYLTPRVTNDLDHVAAVYAGFEQTFILRAAGVPDAAAGPNAPLLEPTVMTKSVVASLIKNRDKLGLIGLLESVFSSLASINGSFLYTDERRFAPSNRSSGLDLDTIMDTFNMLAEHTDARQFSDLIIEMCSLSLFNGDAFPSHSRESLRVFLILPWLDAFVVNVTSQRMATLHQPFAALLDRLPKDAQATLINWWTGLPRRHFKRIVSSMIAAVRVNVLKKESVDASKSFLLVLQRLSTINKKTSQVPLDVFYIAELQEHYNLKEDYARKVLEKNASTWSTYPFLMNGMAKGELLQIDAVITMHHSTGPMIQIGPFQFGENPYADLHVSRENLVHDTIAGIRTIAQMGGIRKRLKVHFAGEEAEDAGGVIKEFFMLLFQKLMAPEYAMFLEDAESHFTWFSGLDAQELEYFQVIGALCGLAVYNQVLVAFPFPLALYKCLLAQPLTLDDLSQLSPTEGRSLQSLLDYEGDDFEDVFCLNYTINYSLFGDNVTEELKPHGNEQPVTMDNRADYVKLYVQARMQKGPYGVIGKQIQAFCDGFLTIVNRAVVELFQPQELMEQVVGNEEYDWTAFREVTQYKGVYHATHPTILAFWDAFFELSADEKKKFLQFLMGSTRIPVTGMEKLQVFIQPTAPEVLPVAHTCFNLLDLPDLPDKKELLRRLRISIEHTEGFTLV